MKYKEYPKYKDSGVEWIGEIPEHWDVTRYKFVCSRIDVGIAEGATHAYVDKNGIPIIRSTNVKPNKINSDDIILIAEWFAEKNHSKYLLKNDIVTVRTGYPGTSAVVPEKLNMSQCFTLLCSRLLPKHNPFFFSYVLNSISSDEQFQLEGWGTAQINISVPILENLFVTKPPLEEENQISEFLDKQTTQFDELIAKSKKQITILEEKRQATIIQAVTKGLDPSVPMKDSGIEWLGSIPVHWEIQPLKYHVKINQENLDDKTDPNSIISYIDVGSVHAGGKIDDPEIIKFSDAPSRARRIIKKNDTILSTVRTYLKAIAFVDEKNNEKICSTGFAVLTPKKNIQSKFLYYLLSSQHYIDHVMANSVGVTYPAINSNDLGKFPLILLPYDEAQKITQFLEKQTTYFDELIAKSKAQVTLLKEKKQALITAAVTGKIDVRNSVVA